MSPNEHRGPYRLKSRFEGRPINKSWFLGIGIDRYVHFTDLKNAVRDVRAMHRVLIEQYDIDESITLYNEVATRRNIFRQFTQLQEQIGPDDKLLVFFSGHGFMASGTGYWVPHEAELDAEYDFLPNSQLKDHLRRIRARHVLIVSDSCFSGSLLAEGPTKSSLPEKRLLQIKSRYGICSGRDNEVVWDGPAGSHSPFANSMLAVLQQNQQLMLRASILADEVLNRTTVQYRQLPRHGRLFDVGDEGGQYVFRLRTRDEHHAYATVHLAAKTQPSNPRSSQREGTSNSFTDPRDGRIYRVILLNGLNWMAENLAFDVGEGCWIYKENSKYLEQYGRLYTWEAAQNACPPGWRLPTDAEWRGMAKQFGGVDIDTSDSGEAAYHALLEGGVSGFSALLGGRRSSYGAFSNLGGTGYYWSSTALNTSYAWYFLFNSYLRKLSRIDYGKSWGFSCRCVQE